MQVLLWCSIAYIIPKVIWWYLTPLYFKKKANKVVEETAQNMRSPPARSKTMGSYKKAWVFLARNDYQCVNYARYCHVCQVHTNFIHQPPEYLHNSIGRYTFEAWNMDIIGPITRPSFKWHQFILSITDYFSKWAETFPMREIKKANVVKFVKHHVIYHFRVPR